MKPNLFNGLYNSIMGEKGHENLSILQPTTESQEKTILSYLKEGNKLTPLEALSRFGSMRLGARIFNLRQRGWNIHTEMVTRNGKRVAQYYMV